MSWRVGLSSRTEKAKPMTRRRTISMRDDEIARNH
jgi:hypothetical protein